MKIRKAKPSDAKEISRLRIKTLTEVNIRTNPDYYSKKQVKDLIEQNTPKRISKKMKERDMFCITDKSKILGVIDLKKNEIGGLFVRGDYIKQGIGRKLIKFIEDYAKKKGIKKTVLYSSIYAENFYKRLGYKLIHKKRVDKKNEGGYIEIKMEKKLK